MKKLNLVLGIFVIILILSCQEETKTDIKWNFENFKILTYRYEQDVFSETKSVLDQPGLNRFSGKLELRTKENGKADLFFKDVEIKVFTINQKGDTVLVKTEKDTDYSITDMDEFGDVSGNLNSRTEFLAKVLFPAFKNKVEVGAIEEHQISMPFNFLEVKSEARGKNQVKFESLFQDEAKLSSKISVTEFDAPSNMDIDFSYSMTGDSQYSFDTKKGYFENAILNLHLQTGPTNESEIETFQSPEELIESIKSLTDEQEIMKKMIQLFSVEMRTTLKLTLLSVE